MKEYFFRLTKDEDATVFENHSKNISYGFPLCCLLYLFLKCCSLQTMRFFGAIFKHCVNDGEKKKFSPITKTVNSWWNAKPWLRTTETSWTLTAFGSWTDHHLCESALVTEQVSGLPSTAKVASAEANVEDWSAGLRRATLGNPIHDNVKRKCKLAFLEGNDFQIFHCRYSEQWYFSFFWPSCVLFTTSSDLSDVYKECPRHTHRSLLRLGWKMMRLGALEGLNRNMQSWHFFFP